MHHGILSPGAKIGKHRVGVLPGSLNLADECGVARPGISIQGTNILEHAGPDRIEVNVSGQLQQIRVLLTNDRFVSILKQMPVAPVPQVEIDDISGEKAPHALGQGLAARSHQEVKMSGHERPRIHSQSPSLTEPCQAVEEILLVRLVAEDLGLFNPRPMTWCNVPGASSLGCLGIPNHYPLCPLIVKFIQKQRPL